jgi:hypothetical protein
LSKAQSQIEHEKALAIELNDKNKLSSNLSNMQKRSESSPISQFNPNSQDSGVVLTKCAELENEIERLKRQLLDMQRVNQQRPISHFEDVRL